MLAITDDAGANAVRTFEAEQCRDVVVALALVAALSIDPNASTAPGALSLQDPAISAPAPAQPSSTPWHWNTGIAGGVLTGITPVWLIAGGAFLGIEQAAAGFAPSFRLAPYYAETGVTGPSANSAEFYLLAARADACPLALPLTEALDFRPCVAIDAGLFHARGVSVAQPTEQSRLWLAMGLDLQFTLGIWDDLFLQASGGPIVPFTRPVFVFENPELLIHEVPWLAAQAGLAIGTRFP
jgi:hypothetical protein